MNHILVVVLLISIFKNMDEGGGGSESWATNLDVLKKLQLVVRA